VNHVIITHSHTFGLKALQHTDHLDQAGENFILKRNLPVFCGDHDKSYLTKMGIQIEGSVPYWESSEYLGGKITAVPARHGHGWNHKLMANGSGFIIELPGEPSIYISGDTVLTKDVEEALIKYKPDISVVASGTAQIDIGGPILMTVAEILNFSKLTHGKLVLNHLEALNHCPTTREEITKALTKDQPSKVFYVPKDGETLTI
jgi:L-ascorbate metabolism protein UlaG (beta-lactamase superfamily)